MPDTDPYDAIVSAASGPSRVLRESPIDKIRRIAQADNLPPDIADDFSKVTGLESGRSHYTRGGQVKVSPIDPKDGQRAIGFSQIKPATAKSVGVDDPYDEESNIKAGLRYYAQGGSDPIRRRIAYFSGQNSGAVKHYDRTGQIPSGGDFTGTSFKKYIAGTGGGDAPDQNPYDSVVKAAGESPQKPTTADPYDSIVEAASTKPTIEGSGRGAAMARVTQSPPITSLRETKTRPMVPKGWGGAGTIGEGVNETQQPAAAARSMMTRPPPARASAGRSAFALTPEEQMRITPPGTITPTTNRLVSDVMAQKDQADTASKGLSNIAAMGGVPTSLLPKDAEDWINSAVAQGGSGLLNTAAGLVRHGVPALDVAKMFGAPDLLQKPIADKLQAASVGLGQASQAIDRNADRGVISQGAKDVVGGGIATTPAMLLMSLGIPAPVAFGMQSSAEAQGRDADLADTIKETTKGATIGALFELPLPSRVAMAGQLGQRLAKAGIVGAGTKAVDLASGSDPNNLSSPIVNALFAFSGAPKTESPEVGSSKPASIAPVIADARAERVRAAIDGAQPANITPAQPGTAEAVKLGGAQGRLRTLPQPDNPIVTGTAQAEPLRIERPDTEGAKLNRWQHSTFGLVTESADQARVPRGRVRVIDQDGAEHVIQRANGRGEGNQIAVPVREKPDTQLADEAAQAQENAPFKVTDRRGGNEPTNLSAEAYTGKTTPQQPGSAAVLGASPPEVATRNTIGDRTPEISNATMVGVPGLIAEGTRIQRSGNEILRNQPSEVTDAARASTRLAQTPEAVTSPDRAVAPTQEADSIPVRGTVPSEPTPVRVVGEQPAPRHVDLQSRVKRGEGKGQFKEETTAQSEARRAQVEQASQPAEVQPKSSDTQQQVQLVNTLKWNMGKAKELNAADAQTVIDHGITFDAWANAKSDARRAGYPVEQTSRVAIDLLSGKIAAMPNAGSSTDPYRIPQPAESQVASPLVSEGAKEPEIVKPWEMTRDQIEEEYQRKKSEDDNLEASILGPELAKRYAQLQRSANSSYDHEKANRASDEIEKIESSLSERDRNRLYGIGEEGPQAEELKDYRQSLNNLDDSSPQALAESMRWAITKVGKGTDPTKMRPEQQVAYGTLREAARIAYENGWDTQAISREAVKAAAGRFSDPEDAAFMLDRFIKKETKSAEPEQKQITASATISPTQETKGEAKAEPKPSVQAAPPSSEGGVSKTKPNEPTLPDTSVRRPEIPQATPTKGVGERSSELKPPIEGERSFPKTLEATGREGGTNRVYDVIGDKQAVSAADARISADPEAARKFALGSEADPESPKGKERVITGLKLADQLAGEAEKSTDKVDAATKHAQAIELYTKVSTDLTEAGQTAQAGSYAQKYSREGAPLEVVKIAKAQAKTPKAEDITFMRDRAKKDSEFESRLADLQTQIDEMKAKGKSTSAVKTPTTKAKIPSLIDRFAQMESEAKANLDARAQAAKKQTVGPKGQRGSSVNPVDVALSLKDWTVIGAAKIARGGLNFASWSADMIKDLGEDIRPHLNKIFMAAHKMVSDERLGQKQVAETRAATKAGKSLDDFRQERYEVQVQKRQNRLDMDRKFRDLEKRQSRTTFQKAQDITGTFLTGSLLSYHGALNLLETMTAKELMNTALRIPESMADLTYRGIKRATGKQVPRASSGVSLKQIGGTAKYVTTEGPKNAGKAFMGKPSEVMPKTEEGPFDNQAANLAIAFMPRHYAAKESFIRSIAYPAERQNQASILAHNDVTDGIVKRSELNTRIDDYLNGRASVEGKLNKQYVASLANQAAEYEIKSKNPTQMGQIAKGATAARVKQLTENPTQLIDSLALQYADREAYANSLGPRMQKIQDALNAGGPVPKALIQPFFKRPVNAFNDLAYSYSGLRAVKEGGTAAMRGLRGIEWSPAERQSFNQALARGGVVYALPALGAALAARGWLTSQNDKEHPSSLKIGGKYYAIGNKPVIGWLIAAGATAKLDGAKAVPSALGQMVMDHPLMRGAKNVMDIATEGVGVLQGKQRATKALANIAGKQIGRISPTPIAATAETMDTQNRDTSGLTGNLQSRTPFWRQQLPAIGSKERLSAFDPNLPSIPLKQRPVTKRF